MKICWDIIEGMEIGKKNGHLRKGHYTYIEMDACDNCGDPYLMNKYQPTKYCCVSCGKLGSGYTHNKETRKKIGKASLGNKNMLGKHHSKKTKLKLSKITSSKLGSGASSWKGGVIEKNVPLYDTYAHQIDWVEDVKPIYEDGLKLLCVRCSRCNKWFIPKATEVHERLKHLKGQITNEARFYCSDNCKNSCELFHQSLWPKNNKPRKRQQFDGFSEGDLKVWRQEVLKRAGHICEYCGNSANIAHHIKPKKLEPFLALDPDNGIAVCKKCHNDYCHTDECSTWSLSKIECVQGEEI